MKNSTHANTHVGDGVGFVLTLKSGIVCIDINNCIDANGKLDDEASKIVLEFNSWTEISTSGRGLHIWVKGKVPRNCPCKFTRNRTGLPFEFFIHNDKKMIPVTGITIHGGSKLAERTSQLEAFVKRLTSKRRGG